MAKRQPTFDELVVALKSLEKGSSGESQLSRHVSTVIIAAILGIGAWMITGMNTVQNTLASVHVTIDANAKSLDEIRGDIRAISDQQSAMRAEQAEIKQRVQNLEGRLGGSSRSNPLPP